MLRPARFYRPTLAGLLTLLFANPAAAFLYKDQSGPATLEVRSDHDRPTLALADFLRVVVTIEAGKGLHVDALIRPVPGSGWDVIKSSAPEPKTQENGKIRWQQTLTLAPTAPGELKLELTALKFRDGETELQTIAWKPFTVPVETQIKEADVAKIRDITTTEDPPATPEIALPPWLWFAVPPAVLIVAAAGLWLLLRRRALPRQASAQRKAMRECDRLVAMKLPDKGHGKSFAMLLSGIVRRYLERGFDMPARRQTTAELLRDVDARADMSGAVKRWLHAFFAEADLVKFAGAAVTAERCAAMAEEVRQFCAAAQAGKATVTLSTKESGEVG